MVIEIPFFFHKQSVPIGKKKFQIAQLRTIDGRIINFRQNAAPDREPDASAGRIRRTDPIFVCVGPRGWSPGAPNALLFPRKCAIESSLVSYRTCTRWPCSSHSPRAFQKKVNATSDRVPAGQYRSIRRRWRLHGTRPPGVALPYRRTNGGGKAPAHRCVKCNLVSSPRLGTWAARTPLCFASFRRGSGRRLPGSSRILRHRDKSAASASIPSAPTERHGRSGRPSAAQVRFRQILSIPDLLREQTGTVREFFHGVQEGAAIAAGGEFIMSSLARK